MSVEVVRLVEGEAFRCAACWLRARWVVGGTSSCDYHRPLWLAVAQQNGGRR